MIKLSQLLGHNRVTCVSHCLHNLVTVDTMNPVEEVHVLLTKCTEAIKTLHFRSFMLDSDRLKQEDEKITEARVMSTVLQVHEVLQADENTMSEMEDGVDTDVINHATASEGSATGR